MINISILTTILFSIPLVIALAGCGNIKNNNSHKLPEDTVTISPPVDDTTTGEAAQKAPGGEIVSEIIHPDSIVAFAKTLIGIPYLYASTDPGKGFDCSGFITYVFNHFSLAVPRSSVDFTNFGKEIIIEKAKPGDLILFTGTDSAIRIVGHMGIVESVKDDTLQFIHSSSGKAKGVVITAFENYYRSRFVKIIRVFPEELFK